MKLNSLRQQLPINFVTNVLALALNVLSGLFLVPFYIKHLGVDGYGVIQIAVTITVYVSLATFAINSTVARYLTIDLNRKNQLGSNKTFNTAFWSIIGILFMTTPFFLLFSFYAPDILNLPQKMEAQSQYLLWGVFGGFLVTMIGNLLLIPSYAVNRLDLKNYVTMFHTILKVFFVVGLFHFLTPRLVYVGVAYLLSAAAALAYCLIIWKMSCQYLTLKLKYFDRAIFTEMYTMGGWLTVGQVGSLFFLQVDLLIVNALFGAVATGEYAVVLQLSTLLRYLAGTLNSMITPMILIYFAEENLDKIIFLSKSALKFIGMFMALPVGLTCGFAPQLLSLWIGEEFVKLAPLVWLLLAHLVINLSVVSLISVNSAFKKVKVPGVVTIGFGVTNIFLAILLAKYLNFGVYGVALAGAITLTLKNAVFLPVYAAHIIGEKKYRFLKPLVPGLTFLFIVVLVAHLLGQLILIDTWVELIITSSIVCTVVLPIMWHYATSHNEKDILVSLIPFLHKKY